MSYAHTETIRRAYGPEMAHRHVVAISQFHRIQASPGFRAAAHYVVAQLAMAGLQVAVRATRPMPPRASGRRPAFWNGPAMAPGCSCSMRRVAGETLCDFAAVPISLIQRSIPVDGEFEVVALRRQGREGCGGLRRAWMSPGKLVLTSAPVAAVAGVGGAAVRRSRHPVRRHEGRAAAASSICPTPGSTPPSGGRRRRSPMAGASSLSPRQGQGLRAESGRRQARARAGRISPAGSTPARFEVVEGFIPGTATRARRSCWSATCATRSRARTTTAPARPR